MGFLSLPLFSFAQTTDVTIFVSPTSVSIGEQMRVDYVVATSSFRASDSIIMVDTETGRIVATQRVGTLKSGTKNFKTFRPGTYEFRYRASLQGGAILGNSSVVTVTMPSEENYTLTASATSLQSGEPLVVTYAGHPAAHQSSDSIVIVNSTTNAVVTSQSLGVNTSGTKTFVLRNPGSYTIQYKLALTGRPVMQRAGPIIVTVPSAELFTITPDITTAEINQPIVVTYNAPAFARQFSDAIVLIESETGRVVQTQLVGSSPSGTKVFRIPRVGTYAFGYRMNITGRPIMGDSVDVVVTLLNLSRISNFPLREGPVIALGDSITFGRDATQGRDFVSLLSERLGEPIVNAGVVGDTTEDSLLRLDRDVIAKHPRLVIIFLGGNDFLQKVPADTTFNNLELIVDRIQADGGAVMILGYKNFLFVNYDPRYRTLALEKGAAYVPDVMKGILGSSFFTTDAVHPRNNGHEIIANRVEPQLRVLLGK